MTETLAAAFAALAIVAGGVRAATATTGPARLDGAAVALAAAVPAAALWGWHGGVAAAAILGCIGLWFLWRGAAPHRDGARPAGSGRAASVYRLVFTAAALWFTLSISPDHGGPHGQELGNIIQHMIAAVALSLACAGWLLGTFGMPKDAGGKLRPVLGVHEAVAAAAMALCFFSAV